VKQTSTVCIETLKFILCNTNTFIILLIDSYLISIAFDLDVIVTYIPDTLCSGFDKVQAFVPEAFGWKSPMHKPSFLLEHELPI
jgi:hypothetical protein